MNFKTDELVEGAWVLSGWIIDPGTVLGGQSVKIICVEKVLLTIAQLNHVNLIVDKACLDLVEDPAGYLGVGLDVYQY